jgi:Ca2+-binding EF-hand superfamily protein
LLSSLECEAGLIDLGFSLVEVAELFSRSDRNTDGSLSLEEFRAGVMQCVAVV